MKNMKKLLALALVIMSVVAIAVPAMAVTGLQIGQTATVSVNSAGLKIRRTASTNDGTYWIVGNGTEVKITSVPNNTWYGVEVTKYVKGSNGTGYVGLKGYAQASFITGTPTPPSVPNNWQEAFGATGLLKQGDRGIYVQNAQKCLIYLGYLDDIADGVFGEKTFDAVWDFQFDNRGTLCDNFETLDGVDGILGPRSKALLYELGKTALGK